MAGLHNHLTQEIGPYESVPHSRPDELIGYRAEDTELCRAMYSMAADHAEALIREEEKGYARGLADAKAHPETLGLTPSAGQQP